MPFPSRNARVAEAVKAALNDAFVGTFVAARKYAPASKLADLAELRVTVFSRENPREFVTRKHSRRDFVVDVGVQKRLASTTDPSAAGGNAELDDLLGLAEAIADALPPGWVAGDTGAQLVKVEHEPTVDRAHLLQYRAFTNVVTLTFRLTA